MYTYISNWISLLARTLKIVDSIFSNALHLVETVVKKPWLSEACSNIGNAGRMEMRFRWLAHHQTSLRRVIISLLLSEILRSSC